MRIAKQVSVISPVPFHTAVDRTLDMKHGSIIVDMEHKVVIAQSRRKGSREVVIPFDNVAFIEIASEADLAPAPPAKTPEAPVPPKPAPAEIDVVKFEKDASGQI